MASEHIKIGDVTPRVQYAGDGVQTQFGFSFPIFENDDLEVYLGVSETPEMTGYSTEGAGDSAGGLVTFDTPPGTGVTVTLLRNVAIKRTTDFSESGDFRASVINNELDRLTAVAQQLSTLIGRSVRLAETDAAGAVQLPPANLRASKLAAFDASGDLVAASPVANVSLISTFMEGVVLAANADAGRSLLNAQAQSDVLDDIAALTPAEGDALTFDGTHWTAARTVKRSEIRRLALDVAALKGDRENMVDGIADPFADETDLDNAASTNEAHDVAGAFFAGSLTYSADETGSGTILASEETAKANLFDDDTGTLWTSLTYAQGTDFVGYDFGDGNDIEIRRVRLFQKTANYLEAVKVQYSDNGADWTDALTATGLGANSFDDIDVPATEPHRYWRLLSNAAVTGGANWAVHDVEMLSAISGDMTLVSVAFTADAQPDTALLHIQAVGNDAFTLNTDLIGKVSRDNGATWTTAVLAAAGVLGDGTTIYEATGIDISGQPSGTDMRYRIETDHAKDIEIHGVVLKWG
ncbi:hypothetical protein EOI86_07130 [Hwanghaeella grinnelliae]|uniref:F5/8 type C domain-containing protein n=1 Tax=Hwanghaeella grinnelliae TaxID=2500179 RepID=A0A3S2W7A8_9PROT|nr:hypothetical protein [Hwanghaeella grinnelliae]RVU39023.1 hypothetical protein EOI86_07130 [Hwanghaeella grinnelliae]